MISYIDGLSVSTSDISPSGAASFNAGFVTLVGSSGNGTYSGTADIDDLGVWTRVLTPQEVAGIYGAGLNNQPLSAATAGVAPVIASQPVNVNVSVGSTATFTVTRDTNNSFTMLIQKMGFNVVELANTDGIVTLQITGVRRWSNERVAGAIFSQRRQPGRLYGVDP